MSSLTKRITFFLILLPIVHFVEAKEAQKTPDLILTAQAERLLRAIKETEKIEPNEQENIKTDYLIVKFTELIKDKDRETLLEINQILIDKLEKLT